LSTCGVSFSYTLLPIFKHSVAYYFPDEGPLPWDKLEASPDEYYDTNLFQFPFPIKHPSKLEAWQLFNMASILHASSSTRPFQLRVTPQHEHSSSLVRQAQPTIDLYFQRNTASPSLASSPEPVHQQPPSEAAFSSPVSPESVAIETFKSTPTADVPSTSHPLLVDISCQNVDQSPILNEHHAIGTSNEATTSAYFTPGTQIHSIPISSECETIPKLVPVASSDRQSGVVLPSISKDDLPMTAIPPSSTGTNHTSVGTPHPTSGQIPSTDTRHDVNVAEALMQLKSPDRLVSGLLSTVPRSDPSKHSLSDMPLVNGTIRGNDDTPKAKVDKKKGRSKQASVAAGRSNGLKQASTQRPLRQTHRLSNAQLAAIPSSGSRGRKRLLEETEIVLNDGRRGRLRRHK
jgi:hypothetical protein